MVVGAVPATALAAAISQLLKEYAKDQELTNEQAKHMIDETAYSGSDGLGSAAESHGFARTSGKSSSTQKKNMASMSV